MIAVDTNVLVYANRAGAPLQAAAQARLAELAEGDEPWGLPVACLWGFVRVVTQPVFDPPTPLDQALDVVDRLLASPSVRVLAPGARHRSLLRQIAIEARAAGRVFTDAVIVALCKEHGVDTILTNDRDFRRFSGIRVKLLTG